MDIERVELASELLRKSSQVVFWINEEVYEYYNIKEIVEKLEKQYGLIINLFILNEKVTIIIKVKE